MKSPDEQKNLTHDLQQVDISDFDIRQMRSMVIDRFVNKNEPDQIRNTLEVFLGYLTANGYRITKVKK